jgi:hypothetical protein
MGKSQLAIVIILRVIGVSGLFAVPAIFFPFAWMNAIHDYVGLGELPNIPIVNYLARSLSVFYAMLGAFTLFISLDIQRYRPLVFLWAVMFSVLGCVLLCIDLIWSMPHVWTLSEGPPVIAVGIAVLWLHSKN